MMQIKKILGLVFAVGFLASTAWAANASLYEMFDGKSVKVFLEPISDVTKEKKVSVDVIQAKLKEALENRKSIRFSVVMDAAQADLVIGGELNEFVWSDHDPVDMLMGVGAAAADAARVEDYARVQVTMTVTDAKKNQVLWQDRVMATVTKESMDEAQSLPLVSEDLAKTFIKQCFAKSRKNR